MTDFAQLIITATHTFKELSNQANALGTGLLNAAPGSRTGVPNNSIQYLLDIATILDDLSKEGEKLKMIQKSQQPGIKK